MELPTVPTDNLYKFTAIVGLLMFAAGLLVPAYVELEYIKVKTRFDAVENDIDFRLNIIKDEAEWNRSLHKIISDAREAGINAMPNQTAKERELALAADARAVKEAEAILAEGQRINGQLLALKHESVPQAEQAALTDYLNVLRHVLHWISGFFVVGGITLASLGFRLWFVRLQNPLDKLVASRKASRRP
jgi:hypothetical protein